MSTIEVKRGDTFLAECVRTDAAGDPVALTGTGSAKLRRGALSYTLSYTVTDSAAGAFNISATAAATAEWALGLYDCDVEFTQDGSVYSTETFHVLVIEDVTFAG